MEEKLQTKVESVEGIFPEQYLLFEEEGELVYSAVSMNTGGYHPYIVAERGYSPEQIMGGGMVEVSPWGSKLQLFGESEEFGPVPEEILKEFIPALEEVYKELVPNLEEIEVSPSRFWSPEVKESKWGEYLERLE